MHTSHISAARAAFFGALALFLLVLSAIVVAGWTSSRPVKLVVDGVTVEVAQGTTCSDLIAAGLVKARAGDLIGVDGSLVAPRGGEPPVLTRNGSQALPWQRIFDGDRVESAPGHNRVESMISVDESVPFETRYEGQGSIMRMSALGAPGVVRVTRGAISGAEVARTVVSAPEDAVFVRSGPAKGAKLVALTFDDGPEPGQTDAVLNLLRDNNVKATFFVLGDRTGRHPELVKRAADEGHQIANHSFSHKNFAKESEKEIRRQIVVGQRRIRNAVGGDELTPWIRPPYGRTNARAWKVLKAEKQRVVMWDVDPQDWRRPGTAKIANRVISNVEPGSIVLLHDGGSNRQQTISALPKIIRVLKQRGYEFVTVEELDAAQ